MTVFVDTSALFAVLDADDRYHARARELWEQLIATAEELVCTNYVLIETFMFWGNAIKVSLKPSFVRETP